MIVVKDIVRKKKGIKGSMPVRDFIAFMKRTKSSLLVIVDESNAVRGVVTEKDLIKLVSFGVHGTRSFYDRDLRKKLLDEPVSEIMTRNPVTIKYNATPEEAMHMMAKQGFRRLIVVDERNALIGTVRMVDLVSKAVE